MCVDLDPLVAEVTRALSPSGGHACVASGITKPFLATHRQNRLRRRLTGTGRIGR